MVKASEIRLGNWIQSKPSGVFGSTSATQWQVMIDDFLPIFENPNHYSGIPLTEDWLLRFGFVDNMDSNSFRKETRNDKEVIQSFGVFLKDGSCGNDVWNENFADFMEIRSTEECDAVNFSCKIDYVHQLQNLYFALTSEELTIKQPEKA